MKLIEGSQPTNKFIPFETITFQPPSADRLIHCLITEVSRYDREFGLVLLKIKSNMAKTLDEITEPKYVLRADKDRYFIANESLLLTQNPRPFALLPASTSQPA